MAAVLLFWRASVFVTKRFAMKTDLQNSSGVQPGAYRKLSVREAASFLGVSKSFLDKLRHYGSGPHYLKLGRRVVYDIRDIET